MCNLYAYRLSCDEIRSLTEHYKLIGTKREAGNDGIFNRGLHFASKAGSVAANRLAIMRLPRAQVYGPHACAAWAQRQGASVQWRHAAQSRMFCVMPRCSLASALSIQARGSYCAIMMTLTWRSACSLASRSVRRRTIASPTPSGCARA